MKLLYLLIIIISSNIHNPSPKKKSPRRMETTWRKMIRLKMFCYENKHSCTCKRRGNPFRTERLALNFFRDFFVISNCEIDHSKHTSTHINERRSTIIKLPSHTFQAIAKTSSYSLRALVCQQAYYITVSTVLQLYYQQVRSYIVN